MDKISIIIPVYNVEPYIKKCLDSVINQTHTNLEILLINDGSTDSSGKICDEYAKLDNRIKVFHKENRGVSSARNIGLQNMSGDYVAFVDSDDWIEPNMYETLYEKIKVKNISISVCGFYRDNEKNSVAIQNTGRIPNRELSAKEMLLFSFRAFYYAGFEWSVWNKLFKASLIKNEKLFFDTNLKYAEDAIFFIKYVLIINNSCGLFVDKPLYHYYQRNSSATHTVDINKKIDWLEADKKIIDLIDLHGYSDICVWVKRDYCYKASLIADEAIKTGDKRLIYMMQKEIKLYLKEYLMLNQEYPERIERINLLLSL